jgi:hypothetical protein
MVRQTHDKSIQKSCPNLDANQWIEVKGRRGLVGSLEFFPPFKGGGIMIHYLYSLPNSVEQ